MEPAPELEDLTRQIFKFFDIKNAEFIVDAFSRHEGTLAIGTALEEWWEGHAIISAAFNIQLAEMPVVEVVIEKVEAWQEGSIGWVSMIAAFVFDELPTAPMRATIVARKEGTYWRLVNLHVSVPTSNEAVLGRTLTTAFDELVSLVANEPPPISAVGPDGKLTIVFTDIVDSTTMMESLGEESWTSMRQWHDALVTQQTKIFGGVVVKGQGDGFMLAFPANGAATACAVAIQHTVEAGWNGVPVSVRIGLHCGNALEESGDFFGRTVIIAARIASAAKGREVLVSQDVQHSLMGAFALGEPESLTLKGLSGTFTVFPVVLK